MSIPNAPEKYGSPALIEPARVVRDLKAQGRFPSCAIPSGAIVCYDPLLWPRVGSLPGRVECDGALAGAFLLPRAGGWVLVMKAAGVGAPTAVMTLEELSALGVTAFVNLGTAGGLDPTLSMGDIVICDRAIRDEGTSFHYLPDTEYSYACPRLTDALRAGIEAQGLATRTGTSWTTDAPYRETVAEFRRYRAEGVTTVEMEASALFAVGEYRGVGVSSIFAVSDVLSEEGWASAYRTPEIADHLMRMFEVAVDVLASYEHRPSPGATAHRHAAA